MDDTKDPVLLIPGIGGSVMEAIFDGGRRERVWIRLLNSDHEFKSLMWSKFNPVTGRTESLHPDSRIEVPDRNFGLYAVESLDPDLRLPLEMVHYYHEMMIELRKLGYVDGQSLFGFGFDFRQSNRLPETMSALGQKLADIHRQTGKKVNIVTHSMGGLVVKSYLALHQQEFAEHVAKWVAIAAPFRGAPAFILDTLLTGVEFLSGWQKDLFIAKWSMHQLLVECPSVYELITDYDYGWLQVPELRMYRPHSTDAGINPEVVIEKVQTLDGLLDVLDQALRENQISVGGSTVELPLSQEIVELAMETKRIWAQASIPDGVKFYNIYGTGLDTPYHTSYGSVKDPISDPKDILSRQAVFEHVDGDGTVPLESSKADGLEAQYRIGVTGEHRALLRDSRVFRLLSFFLESSSAMDASYDPNTDFVIVPSKEDIEELMLHREK